MKFNKIGDENTPPMDRNIIIVVSKEDLNKLAPKKGKNIIWEVVKKLITITNPPIGLALETGELITNMVIKNSSGKPISHIGYDIDLANKLFKFEPGNPIPNKAYATISLMPEYYFSINSFHEKVQQMKHSALLELCASLGAKEINFVSGEINNKIIDVSVDANVPTELGMLGLKANMEKKLFNKAEMKIGITFGEKNKKIKDFDSPWIATEPTWQSMKKMRIENHVKTYSAEFNYIDDLGIDTTVSANLKEVGINIGGQFTEIKKIKISYQVLFW